MRILVCGDRRWTDYGMIWKELVERLPIELVIHGGARGADALAGRAARELGIPVSEFPAEWSRYGRAAGPIRNRRMLDEGKPDLVLAFHNDINRSLGTRNMVRQAVEAGVPVEVVGDQLWLLEHMFGRHWTRTYVR